MQRLLRKALPFCIALACMALAPSRASAQHSTTLNWSESTTCAAPCTITYNVFRGTSPGAENTTPLNSSPIASTTFTDSTVSLGNTYFYVVQAVETNSGLVLTSANSNEVSAIFPPAPTAPALQPPVLK